MGEVGNGGRGGGAGWGGFQGRFLSGKQHELLSSAWRLGAGGGGDGVSFLCFHFLSLSLSYSAIRRLLTVTRSRVLDLQQHPHRTSSLFHGTFTGVRGVVAGAHRLVRPALGTGLLAQRAAAAAHPSVPQTLFPRAALDVLARLGL